MTGTDFLHIAPRGDGIEHDTSTGEPDCVCGPTVEPVKRGDGSMGWLIVHHSLDTREQPGGTNQPIRHMPPLCRECGKRVRRWQSYGGWGPIGFTPKTADTVWHEKCCRP